MQHLIDRLLEHEELEVRRFAKILQQEVKNSLLELAFSDGTGEGIKFDKRSVILSVEGLSLPKPDKSPQYYEKHERKSLAIMLCVGKYIELFGKIDEKAYTYEFFDRAWTLTRSAIRKRNYQ